MKKIAILRGRPTSGKSTAFHNLKKIKEMEGWIFIDHPAIKKRLGKEKAKEKLHELIKEAMKTGKNIITEESSRKTLNKYLRKEIKKCKYRIIVFQFTVSTEAAYRRDIQRAKAKWHPFLGKKKIEELHKMHDEMFDKKAFLVDTDKLNKKEVVELIIKKLTN